MNNGIQIIKELEGVIGAVLGSVSTLIITYILKKLGKLNFYFNKWESKFRTYKDVGCSHKGKTEVDIYDYFFELEMQIYNSSDSPKIVRNIAISFYKNKKEQKIIFPYDESTRERTSFGSRADILKIVNINPRQLVQLDLMGYINEDELFKLEGIDSIFIKYFDEKDRVVKKMITTNLIS